MMKIGLLIGVRTADLGTLARSLQSEQIELHVAISFEELVRIFAQETIAFVFLGCGLDLEHKLRTLAYLLSVSPASDIHVMGCESEPAAFVAGILESAGIE